MTGKDCLVSSVLMTSVIQANGNCSPLLGPVWNSYTPENQVLLELNSANTRLIPDTYREEQLKYINQNPITFLHRRWF